ncbi:hypothetical protein KKHLCK_09200 [Candidatus Electrothrix laxa]
MSEYVRSDIFVGRTEEQDAVHSFIQSDNNSRLLCIYSTGEGGFGKTQLLLQVCAAYREEKGNIVIGHQLIDFYHLDMQRKMGVIEALAKQLDLTESLHLIAEYRQNSISSEEDEYIEQLFKKFSAEYQEYVSGNKERIFVFLFDSYEHIQRINKDAHSTDHSHWIETKFIPLLVNELNVRVILAGRHLPTELVSVSEKPIKLKPFSEATSENFLRATLEKGGGIALEEMQELYRLTDGHPIRLALSADWLMHSSDPVKKLLAGIEPGKAFESRLIKYIRQQLEEDESFFISSYIAIAYQRLNADILQYLTDEKKEDCERYIEQMRSWSFIKPKGKDSVILHDVMHSLFDEYIKSEDPRFYRDNLELLLGYYKKVLFGEEDTLPEEEQEQYILEMVNYGFQLDFDQGVERFCTIFDQIMEDGQYGFASKRLLVAAEDLKFRHHGGKSNTLNFLKIDARKIDYHTETASAPEMGLKRADNIITQYTNDERWKGKEIEGLILLKKGTALFALGRFQEAIKTFLQSKPILLQNDEGINAHWATSWTGYTYYQLGDFVSAEKELNRSRKLFYKAAVYVLFKAQAWNEDIKNEYRRTLQGYQISLVNLALVYFSTGRFYEAVRHARIFLHINQNLQRNDKEIARAQTTLALTSWSVGYRLEAKLYLADALKRATGDRLLIGRIKTEQLRQEIHNSDFFYSSFLEFYRANDFQRKLRGFKEKAQKKEGSQLPGGKRFQETIQDLEALGTTKELLTAYIVQAKLYLLNIEEHSFSTVEDILKKGLQEHTEEADIQAYEKIQALENLVRLCYFARVWDTVDAQAVSQKLESYQEELEREFTQLGASKEEGYRVYPELSARYHILLGNIAFDEAIRQMSLELLRDAVQYYLIASDLLENFESFCEYPFYILRHRLITFIQNATEQFEQKLITKEDYSALKEGYTIDSANIRNKFYLTFTSTLLCLPRTPFEDIEKAANEFHQDNSRSLPEKIIQAKSLIAALEIFIQQDISSSKQQIKALLLKTIWLMQKARFYRRLRTGDINFALAAYNKVGKCLNELAQKIGEKSGEVVSLKGRLAIGRGTVHYRQGAYEDFLEFYMKDELKNADNLFKKRYKGESEKADDFLVQGINSLKEAQVQLDTEESENIHIGELNLSNLNACWLGAAYFRLGELKCLNGEHSVSLAYLKKSIKTCRNANYLSRMLDAMESYITVSYYAKKDDQELSTVGHYKEYTQEIEKYKEKYPIILGKLRITQGDDIFTRLFRRDEEKSKEKGVYQDARYCLREKHRKEIHTNNLPEEVKKSLRTMMTHYIEACSLMKHAGNMRNFVISVRVIIRRFRMLSDALVLEKAHSILDEMWDQYPNLQESEEELKTVSSFARILEGLIKETSKHPLNTAAH